LKIASLESTEEYSMTETGAKRDNRKNGDCRPFRLFDKAAGNAFPARRLCALWLVAWACFSLAALAVYGRAAFYPFLLDDHFHFVTNPTVRSFSGLPAAWTTNYFEDMGESGLYRPLLKTIWTAEIVALGGSRAIVLLISAIVHGLNGSLVALLGVFAGLAPALSFAAGLWFVLHAAHSEVLLQGVGQGEIIGLALALAAIALVFPRTQDRAGERPGKGRSAARLTFFWLLMACGLLVKEQAFMAVAIGAMALILNAAFSKTAKVFTLGILAATVVAYINIRIEILGAFGPQGDFLYKGDSSLLQRVPLILYLFGRFIALALAPVRLIPDYTWLRFDPSMPGATSLIGLGLAGTLAVAALFLRFAWRRDRFGFLLLCLTLAPLVPFIGIRPIGGSLFGERHAYHALAGAALLVALGGQWILTARKTGSPRGRTRGRVIAGLICLWALGLGYRASLQVSAWSSGKTLWKETWRQCPPSFFAAANLAYYQMTETRFAQARQTAQAALELRPDYDHALLTLGELDLIDGEYTRAKSRFSRIANHPVMGFPARLGIVRADQKLGHLDQARVGCMKLLEERGNDPRLITLWKELEGTSGMPANPLPD